MHDHFRPLARAESPPILFAMLRATSAPTYSISTRPRVPKGADIGNSPQNPAREARNAEPIAVAIDDTPTSGPIEKLTK